MKLLRIAFLGVASVLTLAAGATASSVIAAQTLDGGVEHIVVLSTSEDEAGTQVRSEYWIDRARGLAKAIDQGPQGESVLATGPNWALSLPAQEGPGYLYTTSGESGITRAVYNRLYIYRDELEAGRARLVSETATTKDIAFDMTAPGDHQGHGIASTATIDRSTGVTLSEVRMGTRVNNRILTRGSLPRSNFPESFFSDTSGRDITTTTETTPAGARAAARFPLALGDSELVGRDLKATLVFDGWQEMIEQQINQVYGEDVHVSWVLLKDAPEQLRPGGSPVNTSRGTGLLYPEGDQVSVLLVNGRTVLSVSAPNLATALAVISDLR